MELFDAIIVGGGTAGLCCAGFAARAGLRVLVVERNERLGRKLLITGKGRCNVTNNSAPDEIIKNVRTNPRFLYSAIYRFPPDEVMAWMEELGVALKTERGNRVFPVSDSAREVTDALVRFAKSGGARFETGKVTELFIEDGSITGLRTQQGKTYRAFSVVLATGGMSYPLTGSDGSGYQLAEACGHSIIPPKPSLIPIVTKEPWCAELSGLSLKNVTLSLYKGSGKKPVFEELGEMLFTHFGVSGPLVLSASSHMSGPEGYRLYIDLKPGLDEAKLDARLLRDFEKYQNKNFANSLSELLPKSLIPVMVELSGIPAEQKTNQITKEQRRHFAALLKALPLTPTAFRPIEEAIITAGGVNIREVDPATMQSKLVRGLFFAGEVLDVDAYTGGYNLQIAFSTGRLAAEHIGNV